MLIRNCRLSFPSLFETEKYNGTDTGKFTATLLIPKDDPQIKMIQAEIKKLATEKFGKPIPKTVKFCLVDGDEKDYDGYEGVWALKASTKRRPLVIDRDKSPLVEYDEKPYPGCYVNASIDLWAMDNTYGKRILGGLKGIQFAKDGEKFGGSDNNALEEFEELEAVAEGAEDEDDPFA